MLYRHGSYRIFFHIKNSTSRYAIGRCVLAQDPPDDDDAHHHLSCSVIHDHHVLALNSTEESLEECMQDICVVHVEQK
jgi:hypothetical protein